MKANELRLGNLFKWGNKIESVKQLFEDGIGIATEKGSDWTQMIELEDIEPIPLTPEILGKANFLCRIGSTSDQWYIGVNKITHDWLFDITWIHDFSTPFYRNGRQEIKYLHQLQNLYFALTGEELTINL